MPRRYFKRFRKFYRRKYGRRRRGNKIWRRLKGLARAVKAEVRFKDETQATATSTTTWVTNLINNMSLGDDNGARDSSNIFIKMFSLRLHASTASTNGDIFRCILLWDKQANGGNVQSNLSDVFQSGNDALALRNWFFKRRFKIIWDRTYSIDYRKGIHINKKIKVKKATTYSGNAGTIADIQTGSLWFCTIFGSINCAYAYQLRISYNP